MTAVIPGIVVSGGKTEIGGPAVQVTITDEEAFLDWHIGQIWASMSLGQKRVFLCRWAWDSVKSLWRKDTAGRAGPVSSALPSVPAGQEPEESICWQSPL